MSNRKIFLFTIICSPKLFQHIITISKKFQFRHNFFLNYILRVMPRVNGHYSDDYDNEGITTFIKRVLHIKRLYLAFMRESFPSIY